MSYDRLLKDPEIVRMISLRSFKRNTIMLHQGEISEGLYIIEKGRCEIYTTIPGSKEPLRHKSLTAGDFFGELSFINQIPMLHGVKAVTNLTCHFIPHEVLIGLSHINPVKALLMINPILELTYHRMRFLLNKLHHTNIMLPTQKNLCGLKKSKVRRIKDISKEPKLQLKNLRQLPFFKVIHHEMIDNIIQDFEFYQAKRNDLIFSEGETFNGLLYVISGALMSFITIKKQTYKLNVFGPGMAVGLMDFFDKQEKISSCIAREHVLFLKITHADFKKIAALSPVSGEKFMYHLNSKVAISARDFYMHYLQAEAIHRIR